MKRISSERKIRRRAWLVCSLIGLFGGLFSGVQTWGEWSDAAKNAATEVAGGTPGSPAYEDAARINFEHNQSINRMGARGPQNGGINNQTYQASQKAFTAKNNQIITDSANACGLKVKIKPPRVDPKTGEPSPLAGTDTDVEVTTQDGKPLTYDQWKQLNKTYNQKVNQYLRKPPGAPVNTGTDLMPDPTTTSPQDFRDICNDIKSQGGTTYNDPTAAKVEGAMAEGKPIVLNEVGSYVKELQGQAKSHFDEAAKTTSRANDLAKVYGENSPQVQDLRAKAQIENSQGAKYIEKIENVGDRISNQSGSVSPQGEQAPSSDLTKVLKDNRGADTIAQSEQIGPLSQNALNNATQKTIQDLARIGQSNPEAAAGCQQAIADSLRDLPMSQKGQAMDMIKTKYGSDFAKGVAKAAQGPTGGAAVMKGFEKVMKVLGPGLLVLDGYKRITGAMNAPDDAKTYVAGTAAGGFIGGLGGALGVGTLAGVAVAGVLGAPVTVGVAGITIGAGIIGGALGYGVGDYAGTSLAGWVLEGVRPKSQAEYDALAAKGLLDGSKDIYGQLIAAGTDPATAAAAAAAYKNGDVKTFRDILASVRDALVKNKPKKPTRLFNALSTNEVRQLLDCLCSVSLGANPWVGQGYHPEPSDESPSCINSANGPCMASGFGCWRSFIRWNAPGISDCLASFNLPTNPVWSSGPIDAAYQKPYEKPFKIKVTVEPMEFCPNDQVVVSVAAEGGRGGYEYRYVGGYPLQPPASGPKNGWALTNLTSVTYTVPDLKRGFYDGQWIYTRPHEAYPTYIQVWARSTTFDPVTGQDVPIEITQSVGIRMRSDDECKKLHPPLPPETKKPPVKPAATVPKPTPSPSTRTTPPIGSPSAPVTTAPAAPVPGTPAIPPTDGKEKTTKIASGKSAGGIATEGSAGEVAPGPSAGWTAGSSFVIPKGKSAGAESESAAVPKECSFGGGATAIDNGPLNMFFEVPPGNRVRVTIKGSDGYAKTIEGVGKVEIARPRNPSGTDTITMENLDVPGCQDMQVAQYDTNGIPHGMPVSTNTALGAAEAALPEFNGAAKDGALGTFVGGKERAVKDRTQQGFDTMGLNADMAKAANAGNQQLADARNTINQAGAESQGIRDQSARDTTQADRENSWGKTMADSLQEGFESGAKAAASAFGAAAADKTAGEIFGGTKSSSNQTEEEEPESGEGEQVASAGAGASGLISSGGGDGGGGQVPMSQTISNPAAPGTPNTVTCAFCGHTEVVPPGEQPKPNCPVCGCGADKAMVSCDVCGYKWLVPAAGGPPTGGCPKCGNGGPVTPAPDSTAVGTGAPAAGTPATLPSLPSVLPSATR